MQQEYTKEQLLDEIKTLSEMVNTLGMKLAQKEVDESRLMAVIKKLQERIESPEGPAEEAEVLDLDDFREESDAEPDLDS